MNETMVLIEIVVIFKKERKEIFLPYETKIGSYFKTLIELLNDELSGSLLNDETTHLYSVTLNELLNKDNALKDYAIYFGEILYLI